MVQLHSSTETRRKHINKRRRRYQDSLSRQVCVCVCVSVSVYLVNVIFTTRSNLDPPQSHIHLQKKKWEKVGGKKAKKSREIFRKE
jgi:hypothetical protein